MTAENGVRMSGGGMLNGYGHGEPAASLAFPRRWAYTRGDKVCWISGFGRVAWFAIRSARPRIFRGPLIRFPRIAFSPAFALIATFALAPGARAQIIEFESGGLKYQAMTRNGMTIMFSPLTTRIRDYAIVQVAVSNGSPISWSIRPLDFRFERADGTSTQALPARTVVNTLIDKATRGDVIKLVAAYEASLFNNAQIHSTNGYEARRQNAFADLGSTRLKAAAAASAIALVTTKLAPGQSTDGAIFYANQGKPLGAGRLIVNAAGEEFVFPVAADLHTGH
jgi:hypothetical protein